MLGLCNDNHTPLAPQGKGISLIVLQPTIIEEIAESRHFSAMKKGT
jgi:hypothetical protein